ncbi:hypothetical protein WQ54_08070 [Bacillus sp. SA1-12]|nr:hypothetical protein WQ54_08070 [Bacillus sp. SA1-12]
MVFIFAPLIKTFYINMIKCDKTIGLSRSTDVHALTLLQDVKKQLVIPMLVVPVYMYIKK